MDVDRIPRDVEDVSRRARDEHVRAEHLPQLGDKVLQRTHGSLGRLVAPELIDEPIRRDDLAGAQRKEREQGTLLLTAHFEAATVDPHLERPE